MKASTKDIAIAKKIEDLMTRRGIQSREDYLRYLKKQKGIKQANLQAHLKDVDDELSVIEKMLKGEL